MTELLKTDGFKTIIAFSLDGTVLMEELTVTPPALSTGGNIPLSTNRNVVYHTSIGKQLLTVGDISATVAYTHGDYTKVQAMMGRNQQITITWADGSTRVIWGNISNFVPGQEKEGERPTADLTFSPSNRNNSGVETGPVSTAATTTTAGS